MAKTSKVQKNEQRKVLVAKHRARRDELRAIIKGATTTDEERAEAYRQIRKLPRDSSATRIRNRCAMTGRPRAFLRQFGLSRMTFREMALQGLIPGVTKASW
jgi:small subunit ribosomal protein S14